MRGPRVIQNIAAAALATLLTVSLGFAVAAQEAPYKTAGGLTAYLGVMPGELVRGPGPHSAERPMHGRTPRGQHDFHLVVALFDANTGARISDATVTANVSGLGLSGTQQALEPMKIADTITYGTFVNLSRDIYTIKLTVQRPGAQPVALNFKYDHRRGP